MNKKLSKNDLIKIGKIALNVVFYAFILGLLFFAIANIRVKTTADIPNIFGRGFLSVQSPSMDGDQPDSFKENDLIFVNMLNEKKIAKLEIGDIITYYDSTLRSLNTHRIVVVGDTYFITQGDKVAMDPNRKYDPAKLDNDTSAYELILKSQALAVHVSTNSGGGKTLDYLQSPSGFALFIVLPTSLILIFQAFILVKNLLKMNQLKLEEKYKNNKTEDLKDLEQEKELMRQQILEELKKEQLEKDKVNNN